MRDQIQGVNRGQAGGTDGPLRPRAAQKVRGFKELRYVGGEGGEVVALALELY